MYNTLPTSEILDEQRLDLARFNMAKCGLSETVEQRMAADNLQLKEKDLGQLELMLLEGAIEWHPDDQLRLIEAINLAKDLHENDKYKGGGHMPTTYSAWLIGLGTT